jgi:CubicO group peptidase (beta-lactamase class C family)
MESLIGGLLAMMKTIAALIGLVVCLVACAPTIAPAGDFNAFTQALEQRVPGWLKQYNVPGAAIALVHNGEVAWAQGFGLADKAQNTPVTKETIFQVASVSKPVSAWGIMTLVEEGRITLDVPVDPLLSRWHLPPSKFDVNSVTVERLLSHTAGLSLPGYIGFDPEHDTVPLEQSLAGNNNGMGPVELVREPGSAYSYSGGGYSMLQLMVENVVGERFENFMDERVLIPLGMDASRYDTVPYPGAATPYDKGGQPMPTYVFSELAAAGLYSNVKEMGYFIAANMPGPNGEPAGRGVLKPETLTRMFTAMPNTNGHQGLGFALATLPDGTQIIHHNGSNRGWKSYIAGIPTWGEGLVTLTNSEGGAPFNEAVNCAWLGWAAGSTPVECQLDTLIPIGIAAGVGVIGAVLFISYRVWQNKRRTRQTTQN